MGPICSRKHFFEINDQPWFPQYLREKVQSCLTVAWTFQAPILQKASPAQLVSTTLLRSLGNNITDYTYIDFCAGAGGPSPYIERDLNRRLALKTLSLAGAKTEKRHTDEAKFVLTDLHPHIRDWKEAVRKSSNLSYISSPVDATNAPDMSIYTDGKKEMRIFNLAFHHFEDDLAREILKDAINTSDAFAIFELQERTLSSLITITLMGLLFLLITPYYFWRSPGHLFFTYIIPVIPFVLVFDGYVSSLRTRSSEEVQALMKECGASCDDWIVKSGHEQHTYPTGYLTWIMGIKH